MSLTSEIGMRNTGGLTYKKNTEYRYVSETAIACLKQEIAGYSLIGTLRLFCETPYFGFFCLAAGNY